jgi:hypothetical protein
MTNYLTASTAGWYWLTYRTADGAPGYTWPHPDGRFCFYWEPSWQAWSETRKRDSYVLLHPNNGWRLEGPAQEEDAAP